MKELAEVGVEAVAFVSVNDAFVMDAWGKDYQPSAQDSNIRMLADPEGRFTAAMGMTFGGKVVSMLGNKRAYRYAVIVDGGVIAGFQLDETGINNTKAENLLAILSKGCAE